MPDKKLEGSFTPPPAHAPQQITVPGSERATAEQVAAARAHEVDAPVFAPKPMTREQMRAMIGKDPEQVNLGEAPRKPTMAESIAAAAKKVASQTAKVVTSSFKGPDIPLPVKRIGDEPTIVLTDDPLHGIPEAIMSVPGPEDNWAQPRTGPLEPALPPPLPHQPAASNTDSPSRGIPTPIADEGKKITGGFGLPGEGIEAEYFPLTGIEVLEVARKLRDELFARLDDDLRFSIACTYPRAHVRLVLEVDAYGTEKTMEIPKVAPPHHGTPLEIARQYGDQIVFVVIAERQEMTPEGQSVTPPNRMRQEAGLEIPRKQAVDTPSGRQFVDVKS
jgi:hypothetical protein